MSPRFFSQNSAQNDPLKKMPSTAAKATRRWAKGASLLIQLIAHSAFFLHAGHCVHRLEKLGFFLGVLYEGINQ